VSSACNGSSSVDKAQGVVQLDGCKITKVSVTLQTYQNNVDVADVTQMHLLP